MTVLPQPLCFLAAILACWLNRHHALVVAYLQEENRVLREQLGGRHLRFTDTQRRRLARKGKELGRTVLGEIATLVTPDTILRWHRRLVAQKWTFTRRQVGRPRILPGTEALFVRMASENPRWGYVRIQGALEELGKKLAPNTVKNILLRNGIDPVPKRPGSWTTFLRSHFDSIVAMDFFTTEVWTTKGLMTYYTLVALDLATRRLKIVGSTPHPGRSFMDTVARELTNHIDGFLLRKTHVIHDRDGIFTAEFDDVLRGEGLKVVRTPVRTPNCNAHCERVIGSIKSECVDRMIFFGERHFRRALSEYEAHYNEERPHQSLGNRIPGCTSERPSTTGEVECRERLGGLLRYYHRRSA